MIAGRDQAAPERLAEPALVVVAGLDADRRRVEADEQQPVAQRRQVGQRLDLLAVDDTHRRRRRDPVRCPGQARPGHRGAFVGSARRRSTRREAGPSRGPVAAGVARRRAVAGTRLDFRLRLGRLGLRFLHAAPSASPSLGSVFGPRHMTTRTSTTMRHDEEGVHRRMVQRAGVRRECPLPDGLALQDEPGSRRHELAPPSGP